MITYLIALAGIFGFLLTRYAVARAAQGSLWRAVLHNLNRFFLPFATAGLIFSGLQIWLSLSDDLEGAGQTIRALETELARLRTVASFLKPSPALEFSIYLAILFLFVAPLWASHRTVIRVFSGYLRLVTFAYVWLTLLTSLTFFGDLVARPGGVLVQRIATIERHVDRIDQRYAKVLQETKTRFLAEVLPRLVKAYEVKKKDDDDDQWPHIVVIADQLRKALGALPDQQPPLFGGDNGPPPPGPTPAPVSPPGLSPNSASVALTQLSVDNPPIVRQLLPLAKFNKVRGSVLPLGERRIAAARPDASSIPPLTLQSIASAYRGRIDQLDRALPSKPTSIVVTLRNVQATRPQWSLETADTIEKDLNAPSPARRTAPEELLATTGARAVGAAYEGGVDALMDILKTSEGLGLPLGFLAGFVEAVLNESVKTAIEQAIDKHSTRLASGTAKLTEAISGFADEVIDAVAKVSGNRLKARVEAVKLETEAIDKSLAEAQSNLSSEMRTLSVQQFEPRWSGLATLWAQAADELPLELRKPAAAALRVIRGAVDDLAPVERLKTVYACEQVWLTIAEIGPLSYVSAMLRCEELAGRNSASFQQSVRAALPGLLVEGIANRGLQRLIDSSIGDKKISPSDLNGLQDQLQKARSNALGTAAAAARFLTESRKAAPTRARSNFTAGMGRIGCSITAELVTTHYVNGVVVSETSTPVTLPCF